MLCKAGVSSLPHFTDEDPKHTHVMQLACGILPAARSLITRLQLLGASAKELVIELLSPGSIIHRQFSLELGAVCGSRDASGLGTFISSTFSLFSPKQFLPREPGFFLSTDHTHLILARHT